MWFSAESSGTRPQGLVWGPGSCGEAAEHAPCTPQAWVAHRWSRWSPQPAQAASKAAAKAVQVSLDEAKAHQKEMRLKSILNADLVDDGAYAGGNGTQADGDELRAAGQRDHSSFMTVLGTELKATVAHKDAIEQQMLSAMELQHQALPMRFLFTIPGGASLCRTRLQRAFARWIAEFERAQVVVALALWRIYVDECKFREETEVYHRDAGSARPLHEGLDLRPEGDQAVIASGSSCSSSPIQAEGVVSTNELGPDDSQGASEAVLTAKFIYIGHYVICYKLVGGEFRKVAKF